LLLFIPSQRTKLESIPIDDDDGKQGVVVNFKDLQQKLETLESTFQNQMEDAFHQAVSVRSLEPVKNNNNNNNNNNDNDNDDNDDGVRQDGSSEEEGVVVRIYNRVQGKKKKKKKNNISISSLVMCVS
jgi:hypothetical protein